jgi:hypothetical protein
MKKIYILLSVFFIFSVTSKMFAQTYFQQEVNYKIDVRLNDIKHELSAFETIEYVNNSPDELSFIYFHLWPNGYDNNKTALAKQKFETGRAQKLFKDSELRGYIDSLDFKVNGESVKIEIDSKNIDICKIILNKPLKSGEKLTITTPFHVKIPKGVTSRLGHIEQSYQITQWYPKPAVYDIYGWHPIPYLNQGEFYSEFGSFDVSITLPENYVVGATGDLQNQSEMDWLDQLATETAKLTVFDKNKNPFPPSSPKIKTLRYIQHNVHDFAWFADKRFHVLKSYVILPHSQRKVTTWAMFTNENGDFWFKATDYINDGLKNYSQHYGDYPYDVCTAVMSALSAGGGMEYPNITVIGRSISAIALETTLVHEVGHNWFYGIFGFNEREFPWEDEGINSFAEARYIVEKYNGKGSLITWGKNTKIPHYLGLDFGDKQMQEIAYLFVARRGSDQNASLNAADYTDRNYGFVIYMKTARIFDYLRAYLGDAEFDRIMLKFYDEWKYKHPYPTDIQKFFEKETGKDLNWVFTDLLKTTKKVDYKVQNYKNNQLTVRNIGRINSPIFISGLKNGKPIYTKTFEGFAGEKVLDLPDSSGITKIVLDNNHDMTEVYRQNNTIRTSGIFQKTEPIHFMFAGIMENPEKTQINFFPAIGWNNYDKTMLGFAFYSNIMPQNHFEYTLVPMYSSGTKNLAGSANLTYHFLPYSEKLQSINFSLSGAQYAYEATHGKNFEKIKAQIDFIFRQKVGKPLVNNKLTLNTIYASDVRDILDGISPGFTEFYNLNFYHTDRNAFHPYNFTATVQAHEDFAKASLIANYKIKFDNNQGINFRFFGGTFLYKKADLSPVYDFKMSGTSGAEDYTFDHIFFGRFQNPATPGFLSNQFIADEGSFGTYSPFGHTDNWMTSLAVSADIPGLKKIPLAVYGNIATFGNSNDVAGYTNAAKYEWEAGVKFSIPNLLEIYLPLAMSSDLQKYSNDITKNYFERIRFSFNLNLLNPRNFPNYIFK